jgi:hypothetical protein
MVLIGMIVALAIFAVLVLSGAIGPANRPAHTPRLRPPPEGRVESSDRDDARHR